MISFLFLDTKASNDMVAHLKLSAENMFFVLLELNSDDECVLASGEWMCYLNLLVLNEYLVQFMFCDGLDLRLTVYKYKH